MIVNLTQIPSYYLTCLKCQGRWPRVDEMFQKLGIPAQRVVGRESNPYTIAVAESHLKVLEENLDRPVGIYEDDCSPLSAYRDIIEVPDNCAALYLGTSLYGRVFGKTQIMGVVAKDEGEFIRPMNMLGMHSIVYLSREYKEHVIGLLRNFKGNGGCDDELADSLYKFPILAVKSPFFFQDDGRSNGPTTEPVKPIF